MRHTFQKTSGRSTKLRRSNLLPVALILGSGVAMVLGVLLVLRIINGAPIPALVRIQNAGSIRIGVTVDTPPLGALVGDTIVGFEADLAWEIGRRIVPAEGVVLVPVTNRTRAAYIRDERVDVLISMVSNVSANQSAFHQTNSYYSDPIGFYATTAIDDLPDLAGKTVGVFYNSLAASMCANAVGDTATLLYYTSFEELREAYSAGTVDAVCAEASLLNVFSIAEDGTTLPGQQAQYTVGSLHYAITSRLREDDLAKELKKILAELSADGTLAALYATYWP